MRYTLNMLGNLLLAFGLVFILIIVISPSSLSYSINTIISSSMEPVMKAGGLILLKKIDASEVLADDIICFNVEDNDIPVCHRVIEIIEDQDGQGFITKGDALEEKDRWIVRPEGVIGRVVTHVAYLGYLSSQIRSPLGYGLLIVTPAVLLVGIEVYEFVRPKTARVRRAEERRKVFLTPASNFLQIGIVVIVILWLTVISNTQAREYGSFPVLEETAQDMPETRSRIIRNEGRLPLVICFRSDDQGVQFSQEYIWLPVGEEHEVTMTGGREDALITTRGFIPTLPPKWLYNLYMENILLSGVISAVFPLLPLIMLGWFLLGGVYSPREDHRERARQMKGRLI